jgi:protein ImuB
MDLEWPLATLEPLLGMAEGALERLMRRLESQGLGCIRLELALRLDPEGHDARAIALPAPTRDVKTLLTLTRLNLETTTPGAPVVGFTLTAYPDRPRHGQLTLFGPTEISPDKLATTLARLLAIVGEGRVGMPQTVNGHRPERFGIETYDPPPPPMRRREPRESRGLLAVRTLRPPLELEVLTRERTLESTKDVNDVNERSEILSIRSLGPADKSLHIQGSVRIASGPWQLEEAWWSEAPVQRDYWDVELVTGALYRIFREGSTNTWYADGVYD